MAKQVTKFDPKQFSEIKKIVCQLNRIFHTNHFDSEHKIQPFKGFWTVDQKWFVGCDNLYILTDDRRFKVLSKRFIKHSNTPFQFIYDARLAGVIKITVN